MAILRSDAERRNVRRIGVVDPRELVIDQLQRCPADKVTSQENPSGPNESWMAGKDITPSKTGRTGGTHWLASAYGGMPSVITALRPNPVRASRSAKTGTRWMPVAV